jgi:hypothetical protein
MIYRWFSSERLFTAASTGKITLLLSILTVVLAMLLGSGFVAGQAESPTAGIDSGPETTFEAQQRLLHYYKASWSQGNLTTVEIDNIGGEPIQISQAEILVNGNSTAIGSNTSSPIEWEPTPNFLEDLGTNQKATFSSGATWRVHSFSTEEPIFWRVGPGLSDANIKKAYEADSCTMEMYFYQDSDPEHAYFHENSCSRISSHRRFAPLQVGDEMAVVWESASGEESQVLFEYVVAPDDAPLADRQKTSSPPRTDSRGTETAPAGTATGTTAGAEQRAALATVDQAARGTASAPNSGRGLVASDQLPAFLVGLFLGGCLIYGTHRFRRDRAAETATDDQVEPFDEFVSRAGGQVATAPREGGPPPEIPREPNLELSSDRIDRDHPIGKGGNADVYRAVARGSPGEPTVALKQPRFEGTLHQETVDRFTREAETWERLDDHDHIVGVIDWDTDPLPWIAMEYMEAGDLSAKSGDLSFPQAVWTAGRIAEGVRHAHAHGVIHLDLKPSNILLREVGAEYWAVPKIGDWGLAKLLLQHSKSVEELSPEYAAPEQFDPDAYGGTDKRTDIYQLGSIFYELFVGEPAFEGSAAAVLRRKLDGEVTPPSIANPALPAALDDVLLTAMAVEKADRYDSVLVFRNELRDLLDRL